MQVDQAVDSQVVIEEETRAQLAPTPNCHRGRARRGIMLYDADGRATTTSTAGTR